MHVMLIPMRYRRANRRIGWPGMYVKRHAVVKDGKRYVYLRLVQAYRDERGKVAHRVLRTLGREDELKASGQLEQLAASVARLGPPPAGTRRHVGALPPGAHYLG